MLSVRLKDVGGNCVLYSGLVFGRAGKENRGPAKFMGPEVTGAVKEF